MVGVGAPRGGAGPLVVGAGPLLVEAGAPRGEGTGAPRGEVSLPFYPEILFLGYFLAQMGYHLKATGPLLSLTIDRYTLR